MTEIEVQTERTRSPFKSGLRIRHKLAHLGE